MSTATETPPAAATPPATPAPAPAAEANVPSQEFLKRLAEGSPRAPARTLADLMPPDAREMEAREKEAEERAAAELLKKAEEDAAKKKADDEAAAAKLEAEKKPAPATPEVKPAKRVIKRAKGYEEAPPAVSAEAIAEASAKGVVKALKEHEQTAPANDGLNEEEQQEIAVLEFMEQNDPKKFKGVAARARAFISELAQANLDPENTEDADKISELREKHRLNYTDRDVLLAQVRMENEPIKAKLRQTEKELEQVRQQATVASAKPEAHQAAVQASREVAAEFGDTVLGALNADGSINADKAKALEEEDVAAPIKLDAVHRAQNFARATVLAFAGDVDPKSNPIVAQVSDYCIHLEQRIMAMPPEDRVDEHGREFLPAQKYERLSQKERANYYTLTPEFVIPIAQNEILKAAKANAELEEARYNKFLARKGAAPAPAAATPPAKPAAAAPATTPKPASPTVSDGSPPAAPATNGAPSGGFFDRMKQSSGHVYSLPKR